MATSGDEIRFYFAGVDFPARKHDLLVAARRNKAPDAMMLRLEAMPDRDFEGTDEVYRLLEDRTAAKRTGDARGRPAEDASGRSSGGTGGD